ncbi:MAG: DUF1549 domain-containing protein [Verrucomicrobiota bacterium]
MMRALLYQVVAMVSLWCGSGPVAVAVPTLPMWGPEEPGRVFPEAVPGAVQSGIYGPFPKNSRFPNDPGAPLLSWLQPAMGFARLPHAYDDWGVREDWGKGVVVRSVVDVDLEAGTHEWLVRSRSKSRLWVDEQLLLETRTQRRGGDAHNEVDPLPDLPRPGMRPHALGDEEAVASFHSPGGRHRVVFDVMVGGPGLRLEFGETCVAIARPGGMFRLLSPQPTYELTDEGWSTYVEACDRILDSLDRTRRRVAGTAQAAYWRKRHQYARQHLLEGVSGTIDSLLVEARAAVSQVAGGASGLFQTHIEPMLKEHCFRCHGEKEKGGLNLMERVRALQGGDSGIPAIVAGRAGESHLIRLIRSSDPEERMPPKGAGLSDEEVGWLEQWIDEGAEMDRRKKGPVALAPVIDDLAFLRRVSIDLIGVVPGLDQVRRFTGVPEGSRREWLIDDLLNDPRWADNWMGYWQDVLAENPNLLKPNLNNTGPFRYWIHEALEDNKPMDRFATELIGMRGSTWNGGAAGFGIATQNDVPMAAKAHIVGTAFLGVEMKCARCHDAPFHRTKQGDLFKLAALLQRQSITVPASSSVPPAFFATKTRKSLIDVTLPPGSRVDPKWPFPSIGEVLPAGLYQDPQDPREQAAVRVTASRRFAEVLANRVWARFMGAGFVEPVDDWEGKTPSHPRLLSFLADELIRSGYDMKHLVRTIVRSRAYQRKAVDPSAAEGVAFPRDFSGPLRRRMSAEQIVDSAWHLAGRKMRVGQLSMDIDVVFVT